MYIQQGLTYAWKRTRTSTELPPLVPETSVSTNFTIQARIDEKQDTLSGGFCQYPLFERQYYFRAAEPTAV